MTDAPVEGDRAARWSALPSRPWLTGVALLLACGLAFAAASGAFSGAQRRLSGSHRHETARAAASAPAKPDRAPATAPARGTGAGTSGARAAASRKATSRAGDGSIAGSTYEPPDPEAARSFPVSASVTHASAAAPSVAGQLTPAAGAASNAEIEAELDEVRAAEQAGSQQGSHSKRGGYSVAGNGTIPIPAGIPEVVQRVIAGGNAIADFPYVYGGGHLSFIDNAYDCSGSVSYALAAGGLLKRPLVSGQLARWGDPGPGRWITIYANAGHTFMDVDGFWFDTAGRSGPYASRWLVGQPSLKGYAVRHPPGY